jgi:hypothetical protein
MEINSKRQAKKPNIYYWCTRRKTNTIADTKGITVEQMFLLFNRHAGIEPKKIGRANHREVE